MRQVTARFSAPMVALGDPRLADPFLIDCAAKGKGRWVDSRHWVYDFDTDLESGIRCQFTLRAELRTLAGEPLSDLRPFSFDTGGPKIRATLPTEDSDTIDEQQVFLLALDGPVTADSIKAHARCEIKGIAEPIEVDVIAGEERERLLAQQRGTDNYTYLLREDYAGRLEGEALRQAEERLLLLRCRRAIPPATGIGLIWGAGIASPSGIATAQEQRLNFTSRPAFTASLQCERLNAHRPCLPMRPLRLVFSAPVAAELAKDIRLVDENGKDYRDQSPDSGKVPYRRSLIFQGPFPENARFRLELPPHLVDDANRPLENAARFPLEVTTDEYPPLAKFSGEFGIIEAQEGGILPVTLRNLESEVAGDKLQVTSAGGQVIAGKFKRIAEDDQQIFRWLRRVEEAMASRGDWEEVPDGEPRWKERTGDRSVFQNTPGIVTFNLPKAEGAKAFEVVGIPLKEPGFYVVELASPALGEALLGERKPRYVATAALVTNLAVHFKQGRESSLVWVTRLDDGQPVNGATIRIGDSCQGNRLWEGVTGADGIARIDAGLPTLAKSEGDCRSVYMVSARTAEDMSFVLSDWNKGIGPDDFNLKTGSAETEVIAHTVFDRPLFRAGETVSMKHFIRRHSIQGIERTTTGLPDKVRIVHLGSGQEYSLPLALDGGGIGESRWEIPRDAKLGGYRVTLEGAGDLRYDTGAFRVEQFRLPTMKAVLQPPAEALIRPDAVTVDIFVGYLNGGGAADLPIKLRTQTQPRSIDFADYADYSFSSEPLREGIVQTSAGEEESEEEAAPAPGRSGPAGVLALNLDKAGAARATLTGLPAVDRPLALVAELEYPDANGELTTVANRIPLWPAAVVVGLRTDGWLISKDNLRLRVVALDVQGKPVAGQAVSVELWQRATYSYRKRLLGGFYAYENQRETKRLGVGCNGKTDAQGLLFCEIAPGISGDVIIQARTQDAAGRVSQATSDIWVSGETEDWFAGGDSDRMDLLPERQEYQPGETARLQVRMPFRAATALVTVEREGVVDSFVTPLSGRSPVVELPIKANYSPNIYVSVLAVRGRVGEGQSWLMSLARTLHLPWGPEGGPITATVDLSKPAYRLGIAPLRVGWTPHRLEVRVTPDRDSYRVRDTAKVKVSVSRADGGVLPDDAEIALAAVDEALLELKANTSWKLLDSMMGERGIEVSTATAQMQVVGKRHYGRKALPPGGGGGQQAARELFDTLLLWRGRVPLDAQGTAELEVPLNDSLSAFRLAAVANAGPGWFGTGTHTIRSTQELMLHAGLPPLAREGDRFRGTFTLRNAGQQPLTVLATAQVSGKGGQPLAEALSPYRLELKPGEAREVAWPVQIPVDTGELLWEVAANAEGNAAADRLRVRLPVLQALPVRVQQATLTQIEQPLSVSAQRPADAVPDRGGLRVSLRARLGDGLGGVNDYMSRYPYTCLEQRVSKAVALRNPALWQGVMDELPGYLDRDGLLRFFPSDRLQGDDTLTSYVLAISQEAQWSLPEASKSKLLQGLKAFVEGRIRRDSALPTADLALRKLTAIEALSRYGEARPAMLDTITIEPTLWPTSALLDWLNILQRLESAAETGRTLAGGSTTAPRPT